MAGPSDREGGTPSPVEDDDEGRLFEPVMMTRDQEEDDDVIVSGFAGGPPLLGEQLTTGQKELANAALAVAAVLAILLGDKYLEITGPLSLLLTSASTFVIFSPSFAIALSSFMGVMAPLTSTIISDSWVSDNGAASFIIVFAAFSLVSSAILENTQPTTTTTTTSLPHGHSDSDSDSDSNPAPPSDAEPFIRSRTARVLISLPYVNFLGWLIEASQTGSVRQVANAFAFALPMFSGHPFGLAQVASWALSNLVLYVDNYRLTAALSRAERRAVLRALKREEKAAYPKESKNPDSRT